MRILLADHDVRVRSALHILLEQEPGEAVIEESADLDDLAIHIRQFEPDLVLLDWELPGRAAAALLFALNSLRFRPKVLVLSRRPEASEAALAMGADGFFYKGDPPEQLLLAYRHAIASADPGQR